MKSKLQKALSQSPKLEKDELLDFVFWCRQIIALVFGVGAGILEFTGIYVIVAFFIALFLISYIYYSKLLNINEEDYGQNELFMEGVGNAFGLFMLSWILTYTFV